MRTTTTLSMSLLLAHGAALGGCSSEPLDTATPTSVQTALKSRDGGNGNGRGNGNGHKPKGKWWDNIIQGGEGYNFHLENTVRFTPLQPGADTVNGQALFGLAADRISEDTTGALFEGHSQIAQAEIVSNQRTCFTCHRGEDFNFGMPKPPVDAAVEETDTLFTGMHADAQGDPDGDHNLKQHALFKYRMARFNPQIDQEDPFRKVFFWRKSAALVNTAFSQGLLLDGRMRHMFETARGAVFSHTREEDNRFDDLFAVQQGIDLEAFIFSLLSDPRLEALRDPHHPDHDALVEDPFLTVAVETDAQQRGQAVFEKNCMTCHDTPNVFNNLANVMPLGNGDRPVTYPAFGPGVGKTFNVGVSERNKHGLRFTVPTEDGGFEPVVLTMAAEDGEVVNLEVDMDIGLAATTRRMVDIGRFKVPQLRKVAELGPYFHDNSEDTLEGVVDYFLSDWYRNSPAGQRYPIEMDAQERADLLEFLQIL